ncbi:MAG: RNA repair transcriptional activator RtcR [Phycisphaerales bacterium]
MASQDQKPTVIIGLLGTTLDTGKGPKRWERWRPTVSLCQHDDFVVDRLELIHNKRATALAQQVEMDILSVSPETTVVRHVVEMRNAWDFEEVYTTLHDFAKSYPFDTDHEDYLVHITTGTHVAQICNFLLTETGYFPGKLIQTSPPRGKKETPGTMQVIDLDLSKYDRLASRFEREYEDAVASLKDGIETRNANFNSLIERIELVAARTTDPILLTGPTGAGKSRLAKRIFDLRKHRHLVTGDIVEINCATIRGDSAMSTLFGHTKGAFTGAANDRSGLLRKADGGTLFLDEIGELGTDEQAMLLRAIEDKRFTPLGSDTEVSSDFQLIAGTNRNLIEQVHKGTFRDDLLARINLWTFELPALRDRHEDIEPNIEYELERLSQSRHQLAKFSKEAHRRFLNFATSHEATWPGNFRDLNAALTRMSTLAPGGRITTDIVEEETNRLRTFWKDPSQLKDSDLLNELLTEEAISTIDLFDQAQLKYVVEICRQSNSLSDAGRKLFAVSRSKRASTNDSDRVRKYLAKFDLNWESVSSIP